MIRGAGGERVVPATEFFTGIFRTAIWQGELLTEIRVPKLAHTVGWSYLKFHRRAQDWATVGVAAVLDRDNGSVTSAAIGLTQMGGTPLRATAAEQALTGGATAADAAAVIAEGTDPSSDVTASAEFRVHLAGVIGRRAIEEALDR